MNTTSRCRDERALVVWDYVVANGREPLTLRHVGRVLGIGESTIQRALRVQWGLGFHAILDRARVICALVLLLEEPAFKTEALALAVGWRSRSNLYAAVRRVTGSSLNSLRSSVAMQRRATRSVAIATLVPRPSSRVSPQ